MATKNRTAIRNLPAFARVSRAEQTRFESLSTVLALPAGDVLMQEGAFGNEAMLVLEGDLVIERNGDVVAMVGPGSVVGEAALLLNEPRNATVTAASDVVVAAMSRREFSSILEMCPGVGRTILETTLRRAGLATD